LRLGDGGRTSTPWPVRTRLLVPEPRHARGLVDTSVVIDLERVAQDDLPLEIAVSAITMAELALYTRNPDDFVGLAGLVDIVSI